MYDPITSALIASGPALGGLDRSELPAQFTRIYAELVSARLLMREGRQQPDLDRIRRLANAYETYAAVLPERPDRQAAAFVAATAHCLLFLASRLPRNDAVTEVSATHISSDVSACLLFLASGHLADAAEVARRFRVSDSSGRVSSAVIQAIQAIAQGRLQTARTRAMAGQDVATGTEDAATRLYADILSGLEVFVQEMLEGAAVAQARQILESAQKRSVYSVEGAPFPRIVSSFAGPHHLATLLLEAEDSLRAIRVSAVPTPPGVSGQDWNARLAPIAKRRPFLWRNHMEGVSSGYLSPGVSAVLSFPTGAGKSTMAELKVASTLATGRSVLYLVPTHALVGQVARDLELAFPGAEVRESVIRDDVYAEVEAASNAQIAVMTPERALTLLAALPSDFDGVGLVVMDECHLLHPSKGHKDRRSLDAMLCMLTVTGRSPNADVLLMSAMMANHREIADWIADLTGRPCVPLGIEWKPTRQIRGCVVFDQTRVNELTQLLARAKKTKTTKAPNAATKAALTALPHALFSVLQTWATTNVEDYVHVQLMGDEVLLGANKDWYLTANRNETAAKLAVAFANRGMRTLVFAEDPRSAGSLGTRVATDLRVRPALEEKEQRLLTIAEEEAGDPRHVLGLTEGGAVVHHGLLLPVERRLAESVYRRETEAPVVLVGTPTLAQGVNLPAEVVIVSGDDRYDADQDRAEPLEAHELLNAVGRAGRAGFASVGIVLVVPGVVVGCEPKKKLGDRWFQLRKDVFSKMDQCVTIDDPLEVMVDLVQDGQQSDLFVRYFLNRLPTDADALRRLLSRSLGAYRARQGLTAAAFAEKVERAVRIRSLDVRPREDWADDLATSSGIDTVVAQEMATDVTENAETWQVDSVEALVVRLFEWVGGHPERARALLRAAVPDLTLGGYSLERAREFTLMWLRGATLLELERAMTGKTKVQTGCLRARRFVVRTIPDIAYGLGLVAHAYRLAVGEDGTVPLPLAIGAECVKRGLASPEALALAHVHGDERSRAEYAAEVAELAVERSAVDDDFATVMKRIEAALFD